MEKIVWTRSEVVGRSHLPSIATTLRVARQFARAGGSTAVHDARAAGALRWEQIVLSARRLRAAVAPASVTAGFFSELLSGSKVMHLPARTSMGTCASSIAHARLEHRGGSAHRASRAHTISLLHAYVSRACQRMKDKCASSASWNFPVAKRTHTAKRKR